MDDSIMSLDMDYSRQPRITGEDLTAELNSATYRMASAYGAYAADHTQRDLTLMVTVSPDGAAKLRAWTSMVGGKGNDAIDYAAELKRPSKQTRGRLLRAELNRYWDERKQNWKRPDLTWTDVGERITALMEALEDGDAVQDD